MKLTIKSAQHRIAASKLIVASASEKSDTVKLALINAASKKRVVADAIDFIEEEKELNESLRKGRHWIGKE